ncbi:MAG: carboxypeptidase regulatory-like domain-containing protein [Candidatus Hydrogenedentes bacterium]|nr:carboxypeptidase regulatory-like domain-containing protein [Candidatus Hydrogenedentota bacterium]
MNVIDLLTGFPLALRVGWGLLHFFWQGAGLTALLMVALLLMRKRSPQARYLACYGTLLAMAVAPLLTAMSVRPVLDEAETAAPMPASLGTVAQPEATAVQSLQPQSDPVTGTPVAAQARRTTPPLTARAALNWCRRQAAPAVPWLLLFWIAGVLALSLSNLAGWLLVQRMCHRFTEPLPHEVAPVLTTLQERLRVRRAVQLLKSGLARVPATVGWLRPVILIPEHMVSGLTQGQLGSILAHELAHIRRHDYAFNLVQTVIETFLFYHPLVWWVSKRARIERELCCDDLAVTASGDSLAYAMALARVEELRCGRPSLAMAATGGDLLLRIRRLAGVSTVGKSNLLSGILGVIVAATLALVVGWHGIEHVFAQDATPPPQRTIVLPDSWSMGQILIRPWGDNSYGPVDTQGCFGLKEGWKPLSSAQGKVVIPAAHQARLVLDPNAVTDLSPLAYLGPDDLQSIDFSSTEVRDQDLEYLKGMNLRELLFEHTEIRDEGLRHLADMKTLERLCIGCTQVTPKGLQHLSNLTNLTFLDLDMIGVTDESLRYLGKLRKMEFLDLWMTEIGNQGLAFIVRAMPNMRVLGISTTYVTDVGVRALQNLPNLEFLDLEASPVGNEGMQYVGRLTGLRHLELLHTRVTEEGLPHLLNLTNLTYLRLPNTINDDDIGWFKSAMGGGRIAYRSGLAHTLRVVDAQSKAPIAMAQIDYQRPPEHQWSTEFYWTDPQGKVVFYTRSDNNLHELTVFAEGYVTKQLEWITDPNQELLIELEPAVTIGGIVRNEEGEPVKGVTVALPMPGRRSRMKGGHPPHTETTGEDGAWQCIHAPADASTLPVTLHHPDYADTTYAAGSLVSKNLRNETQSLVIRRGLDVCGNVVDENEQPIEGAIVTELEQRRVKDVLIATNRLATTDKQGAFVFTNCKEGPMMVKAKAAGYTAVVAELKAGPDMAPTKIVLMAGRVVRGRVTDEQGTPLPGVVVESVYDQDEFSVDSHAIKFRTSTDRNGCFYWDEAPVTPVDLMVQKEGFEPMTQSVTPRPEEYVFVLTEKMEESGADAGF